MRICPFCGHENSDEKYFCGGCDSYLGSKYPGGAPPEPSDKAKAQAIIKKRKPHKEVEYVQISHGRKMKKSTYDWLQKRDAPAIRMIWIILGISIFIGLIKGCN